jgi:hypothetical protein
MFTSDKYHYSVGYPTDWKITPATELLNISSTGIPHRGDDIADTFESPGKTSTGVIEIAAQELSAGSTLDDWTSTNIQGWRNIGGCEPASREPLHVGGEPATILTYDPCGAFYILHVTFVHGHTGYLAYWLSNPGNEAQDRTTFQQFLATLSFAK